MAPKPHFLRAAPATDTDPAWGPDLRLRTRLVDAVGEALVATDLQGHILYWNDAASRLFGWEADEVIGANALEMTAAGTDEAAREILRTLRSGRTWSGEFLVQDRDGRVFPVLSTVNSLRDEDGKLNGAVSVCRDITREREVERTARGAEERLDLLQRATTSVIREWDAATGSLRWHDVTGRILGYGADQLGSTWDWWAERIHPHDRTRIETGFRQLADGATGFWSDEYRFRTGDRGYAEVFDRAYVSRDGAGRPARIVATMLDVTERRKLREAQRLLSQAAMILDLSLDYEATLPTIARLAVHALADYCVLHVTSGDGFGDFTAAAHRDARLQHLVQEAATFLSAGPPTGSRLERVLRDGEALLLSPVPDQVLAPPRWDPRLRELTTALEPRSAIFVPLRARRSIVGVAVLCRTRDERPYDEHDLQLAEDLGRRIGLAIGHARLFQSAELANRAKADFLAVISHELRTPLTAVLGYADLLAGGVSGSLNPAQRRQVERIRAGSDRLLQLIEGILTYARLEARSERVHLEPASLRDLIRRAQELVAPAAGEKGVTLRVEIGDVPDEVRTDSEKFSQVLLSLLTNAVKFTTEGEVRLRVRAPDGRLELDVADNGTGIAPEHLPHVFNPFWQAEQPETRRAGGAGLGLSVARRLARLMGGDVMIADTSPRGTTVRFQLPL